MGKRSIYWKDLTARHKVVDKHSHWETGSGRLITFGSRDKAEAHRFLKKRAGKR